MYLPFILVKNWLVPFEGSDWSQSDNCGVVYNAKGMGALFAGFGAAWLFEKTGSWTKVFWAMIACDLLAALMALLWLKPLAAKTIAETDGGLQPVDMRVPIKARGVA